MKLTKITLSLALIGALSLGMAEDTATAETTTSSTISVDTQIEAIQAAPAQERVKLMNQFKQRLMTMTQEQRAEVITVMQEKMAANAGVGQQTNADARVEAQNMKQEFGSMTKKRAMAHTQEMQMQTNGQMNQMQNMNQHQAGNQYMNLPTNAPASTMGGGAAGGSGFNMNMGH